MYQKQVNYALSLLVFTLVAGSFRPEHASAELNAASYQQELKLTGRSNKNASRDSDPNESPSTTTVSETYAKGLPELRVQRDIYTQDQLDTCEKYFFRTDEYHNQTTVSEFGLYALTVKAHAMVFNDLYTHRYDSFKELRQSTGPEVDQDKCIVQLRELVQRSELAAREKFSSRDVNLHQFLDTYGRVPPGLFVGSAFWAGMHDECLRLKIVTNSNEKLDTRYCLANIKHKSWPKGTPFSELVALKSGICLPKTCDSLRYKDKYKLVEKLMEFNLREVDKNQAEIDAIYCLPDANSPLRIWWKSPKALQAAVIFGTWLAILIYATIQHDRLSKKRSATSSEKDAAIGLSSGFRLTDAKKSKHQISEGEEKYLKIYKMLSITNNFKLLFDTSKPTALFEAGEKPKDKKEGEAETGSSSQKNGDQIVDLRCLEGIKVICMCYVIMGHVLMCLTSIVSNGRTVGLTLSPTFFLANMMPAFAVNSFFAITGILTSYLMFKQNKSHSFITSPIKWVAFIMYRYLRIMPMYVIVVYYSKYLAKFTGSGPSWDYGTSSLAQRRRCEQESWLWTLMFGANFKNPLEHCIPSAWYLANDFQFFMVTPVFLAALHKSPAFGQRLLKASILAGYLAGFWAIFASSAQDLRPVARFWPHGFKLYVTFLDSAYTWPMYRIPAYLCGLLLGYLLHTYEQDKLKFRQAIGERPELGEILQEPGWSPKFLKYGMKLSLLFVVLCALVPAIASQIPFNKFYAKLIVATFMSTYHIMFALAVGFYILLATTGHGNRLLNGFLSASLFKPLSRLSLCVVLINVEVCNYIMQSYKQQKYFDFLEHNAQNLLSIMVSYLAATGMCILFEAPIRAALNGLLASVLAKAAASKQKVH